MRIPRRWIWVLMLVLVAPAGGQTIRAGRVLDVRSGTYSRDVVIRIEEGKIAAIGNAETVGGELIDLSGYTVLPGLIDAHTHLSDNSYMGADFDPWELPAPTFGIVGVVNARKVLEAGFTTVRNVSEPYFAGPALRDAIESGWVAGPRMYASGPMITMTGGHGDWGNWMAPPHEDSTPAESVADGVDAVRRVAREHIKQGVDLLKLSATGGFGTHGTIPGAATYTTEEIRAAVEEAAKRGLSVAAHAHGAEGIKNAVEAGVRSIEHGTLMDEESMRLMKENGVFLVADLLAAHYDLIETDQDWTDKQISDNDKEYAEYAERLAQAYRMGVRLAFGTDSGIYPHGRNAEQFALLVDAGLSPIDAIRSATLVAAELLGIDDRAGSLEVGKWADLIAVRGDPLEDVATLTEVHFVMKEGVVHRSPKE